MPKALLLFSHLAERSVGSTKIELVSKTGFVNQFANEFALRQKRGSRIFSGTGYSGKILPFMFCKYFELSYAHTLFVRITLTE